MKYKYKTGDKVIVLSEGNYGSINITGKTTVVLDIINDELVSLAIPGHESTYPEGLTFYTDKLRPYKEEVINDKIQVGDIVEIIAREGYYDIIEVGETATVNETDATDVYIKGTGKQAGSKNWRYSKVNVKLVSKANKMKEVIGYKLKKGLDTQTVLRAVYKSTSDVALNIYGQGMQFGYGSGAYDNAVKLGVLDLWFEPVYKSSEVVVSIAGDRKVVITKNKAAIEGVDSMSLLEVKYLYDILNPVNKLGKHTCTITQDSCIKVGCQTFTKQDVNTVYNALVNFKD